MRKYKVFGGLTMKGGKQVRTIVAAKTIKQACEILNMKMSSFKSSWSETGNKIELEVALNNPEKVFIANNIFSSKACDYELMPTKDHQTPY